MSRKITLVPGAGARACLSGGSGVFAHAMLGVPALPIPFGDRPRFRRG